MANTKLSVGEIKYVKEYLCKCVDNKNLSGDYVADTLERNCTGPNNSDNFYELILDLYESDFPSNLLESALVDNVKDYDVQN